MSFIWHDVKYATRALRNSPGFAAVAIIALALGIGANTAIFSGVNSVLLRPLPFRDANRMVVVWESSSAQGWNRIGPSGPNFLDFRDQSKSFEDLAVLEPGTGTVTGFGEPQQVPAMRVSTNFLSVLGVKTILGRDFSPAEGWNQRVVILSYDVWSRHFGKAPDAIGKRVIADGLPYTVIGILPPDFWSPDPADVLVPWADSDLRARERTGHDFGVIGHLKKGVSRKQAEAELNTIEHRIGEQFPAMKNWGVTVVPVQEALAENTRTMLLLLLAAVALVLLIACANLANLMLARAVGRNRETAIRMALGARRRRLMQQFLTESTLLGIAGGALGVIFAMWGVDLLQNLIPHTIQLSGGAGEVVRPPIRADGSVLFFTLLISVGAGLIFGLAPAFAASKAKVNDALKAGSRGSSSAGNALRSAFAISEVALALVLLVASGLVLKSFWRIRQVNPGFIAGHVLAMEMELPTDSKYRSEAEQAEFFRRTIESVQTLPSVRWAGVANVLPLDASSESTVGFLVENRPPLPSGQRLPADYRAVSADYFRAMGIPLRKGRYFTDEDKADRPPVAIISESLARRYWPDGSDPIGQHLRFGNRLASREIIGIVGDVKHSGLDKQVTPALYTSYLQVPQMRMSLVVRTSADPAGMIRAVKDRVYAVDKDQPMYKIRTMDEAVAQSQSPARFTLILLGMFAAVAVVLAAVGTYGVLSYAVTQRTREIGIRIALGAQRKEVLHLVLAQGVKMALIGVIIGLAAAAGVTRLMRSMLFGVSPTDPWTFGAVAILLLLVALAACYIPARRAMRVDPIVALRWE